MTASAFRPVTRQQNSFIICTMPRLGKALCESGTAGQVVFFGGRTVSVLGISYFLHKTGHHKLERVFSVLASGDSAYGVTYSFAHR